MLSLCLAVLRKYMSVGHSRNDVHAEVTCMNDAMDRQTHVDDLLAERFIRNTDCLDTVGDAGT